jgi:hypothetical protein
MRLVLRHVPLAAVGRKDHRAARAGLAILKSQPALDRHAVAFIAWLLATSDY